MEDSANISTSPDFESHEEKGPSSRIKLNHSPEGSLHKIILLDFDPFLYKSMIGSHLYLTASRLDISYSMRVYARYQANPKESHTIALKRIIKCVKTIAYFGVWYSKDTNDVLAGYSNANWTGNVDDRKSISGGYFYVGNNLVS